MYRVSPFKFRRNEEREVEYVRMKNLAIDMLS